MSQKRSGCCQLPGRRVAWPIPALLTRMSIAPNRLRACCTMSETAPSRLRSASIVSRFASLPCSRAAAVTAFKPSRVRSTAATRMPAPSSPLTRAWPMPPAAPVTIAARCVSHMASSLVLSCCLKLSLRAQRSNLPPGARGSRGLLRRYAPRNDDRFGCGCGMIAMRAGRLCGCLGARMLWRRQRSEFWHARHRHSRRDHSRRHRRARFDRRCRNRWRQDRRGRRQGRTREAGHRRRRAAGHPRLGRCPHPLRRSGDLGPGAGSLLLAWRHAEPVRQLRRRLRAGAPGAPHRADRSDGSGRGHPRHGVDRRAELGMGELPGLSRRPGTMPRTIDVAAQIPHHPLRVYVMGERGINRQAATPDDIAEMRRLTEAAIRAGAFGFTTSRTYSHKTTAGELVPGHMAEEAELAGIGRALADAGMGAFGMNSDFEDEAREFAWMTRLSKETGRPVWFLLTDRPTDPGRWRRLMQGVHGARSAGANITAQVAGRPVGVILGIATSLNPFSFRDSYRALDKLPAADRLARLRDPEVRRRILEEAPSERELARMGQFIRVVATRR